MKYSIGKTKEGVSFVLVPLNDLIAVHGICAMDNELDPDEQAIVYRMAETIAHGLGVMLSTDNSNERSE